MNKYDRKKMLLIAPVFFGYYKEIMSEAQNMGIIVDYICDTPSNSNISKAIARINRTLIKGKTKKYFKDRVLPLVKNKQYDYVFLLAGMTFAFTPKMIKEIRNSQKKAEFIMYQWDSEENLPFSIYIHEYFDYIYTFDRGDSKKQGYRFLPLFYTRRYEDIADTDRDIVYDCSYVGTAHPKKYRLINEMAYNIKEKFPRQFIYHYMPSRLKYIYHKMSSPEYKKASFSEFKTKKLKGSEITDIFTKSYCILDAPQEGQIGLTIRTIECLGAKKKIITTNSDIKNYDFYDECNIWVYGDKIDRNSPFFTEKYRDLPVEIYKRYSLRSWITTIIGGE